MLTVIMVLGMLPTMGVVAAENPKLQISGITMKDGNYLASEATNTTTKQPDATKGYAYLKTVF